MSSPNKSDKKAFFAGLHGVITALAALATASVAIIGLSINQGWIGGTKAGSGTAATTAGRAAPQYIVNPTSLTFQLISPTIASVYVSNVGTVPISVKRPTLVGPGASHFTVADPSCEASVPPGQSCGLQVTFESPGVAFNAVLVVQVAGASTTQVPITAVGL